MRAGFRRVVIGACVAVAATLAHAVPASAHVNVAGSTPADGAVVSSAPPTVTLRFDENVDPELADLTLRKPDGSSVTLGGVRLGSSATQIVADLPPLANGVYSVHFAVRDPLDLHRTAGSIVFGVGAGADVSPAGSSIGAPRPFELLGRLLERLALAWLLGALAVALLVAPRAGGVELARRALGFARVGAAGLLVAVIVQLAVEVIEIGSPYGTALRAVITVSSYGRRILVLAALAIAIRVLATMAWRVATAEVLARWRRARVDEVSGGLVALAISACVATALSGHAGTGGAFAFGMALRVLHLGAMGAWAGGLAVLVTILHGVRRARELADGQRATVPTAGDRRAIVAVFGRIAAPAFVVLVATGLVLSGRGVATVTALLTTWYGRLLVVKLAVLTAAGVVGVRHAVAIRAGASAARRGRWPSARSLGLEALLATLVVAGGASLTASPPAVGARFAPPPPATPPPVAQQLDDVTAKLTMRPNRPGPNLVTATIVSVRRPPPGEISAVRLVLKPATGAPIELRAGAPVGGVVEFGSVDLPLAGEMAVDLAVERAGAPVPPATFAWYVDPVPVPRQPTVISDARLAPLVDALAGVVAATALLAAAAARLRRRRSPRPLGGGVDDAPMRAG